MEKRIELSRDWWKRSLQKQALATSKAIRNYPFDPETYYTVQQLADKLSFTQDTIYGWINSGDLNANKIKRNWRIQGSAIIEFLNQEGAERT